MRLLRPPIEWDLTRAKERPGEALFWAFMTAFTVWLNVTRAFGFPVTIPAKGSRVRRVAMMLER
jgi:hypothetical protein